MNNAVQLHTPLHVESDPAALARGKPPLLFLCHRIPYPPDKGDKIRAFHLLRHLSAHFTIYLASFVDDPADWVQVASVKAWCRAAYFRPLDRRMATIRSLRGLFGGAALSLPYYADPALRHWVARTCVRHQIRHALVYSSAMAQFLPADGKVFQRKVMDFVDVDSDKWQQYALGRSWPLSWLYRREARCLLASERTLAENFDAALFVSSAEAALFRQLSPETAHKTGFYNNGVDCHYFDPHAPEVELPSPYPARCQALVFTGAMDYWPNVDAVTWFAQEVMPALRQAYPALEFYIVGSRPAVGVQRLARLPGITVTGRVPDVRPWLRHALAAVAPMRIARGVQNKVLEAMAMARPVLVSRKGLEGIDATPTEHLLLADNAEDYLQGVRELLAGGHAGIGERARDCVQQRFDWDRNLAQVVALLHGHTPHQQQESGTRE